MVYNAMKLFMEINPQLFDDCSHEYTETQSTLEQRNQQRQQKWDKIADQAKQMQTNPSSYKLAMSKTRPNVISAPPRIDEIDPITQDSQKRLDALKLQDEGSVVSNGSSGSSGGTSREQRRTKDYDGQNSVRILAPLLTIRICFPTPSYYNLSVAIF